MESFLGTDTSPSSAVSSPTIRRNRVVLPAPLGPTRPTFSPGLSWKEASMKRTWRPYCLPRWEKEIKTLQAITPGACIVGTTMAGTRITGRTHGGEQGAEG